MAKLIPHVHQKLIIKWANGATIQYYNPANNVRAWEDCLNNKPCWDVGTKYREKPREFKVGAFYPAILDGDPVVAMWDGHYFVVHNSLDGYSLSAFKWIGEELHIALWMEASHG